jgi:hypothetical protein
MHLDLSDGAHEAAADETRPSGGAKMSGCELGEDIVHEMTALSGSRDGVAIGKPFTGLSGHAGTIATQSVRSVTRITFPCEA